MLWNYITGGVIAATWPFSAIGLYHTGNLMFPDRPTGSLWLELIAFVWFLALPWAVGLWLTLDD